MQPSRTEKVDLVGDPGVQETSRSGLSTFLADHEEHGRGFDIQRRNGSDGSLVRVVCGGCGQAIEYPAAVDDELVVQPPASRSVSGRLLKSNRRDPAPPRSGSRRFRPQTPPSTNDAPTSASQIDEVEERRPRSLAIPGRLSAGLVALLIVGGLTLVVAGLASDSGPSDEKLGQAGLQTPAPTAVLPATVPAKPALPPVKLDRRQFAERVSIGIPFRWRAGVSGAAVTVLSRNGRAQVQVYFEQGSKPEGELVDQAKRFLLGRHAGARVISTGSQRVGGRPASIVSVAFPSGEESAVILVADGYTYVLLERFDKPFSVPLRRDGDAVVASFRPA
jgi:hypothetical protein